MALSKEKFHLRTEHSKLLGYWTVELGGLNQVSKGDSPFWATYWQPRWTKLTTRPHQVTHLWEYDSYSHRAGVRAKLGGHQQWQVSPFLTSAWLIHHGCQGRVLPKDPALAPTPGQHGLEEVNRLELYATYFSSLLPTATLADPGEAWELWQLEVSGGGNWEKQLAEVAEELEGKVEGVQLGGLFTSVFGPVQVPLFRCASISWKGTVIFSRLQIMRYLDFELSRYQ